MSNALAGILGDESLSADERYINLQKKYAGLGSYSGVSESGESIKLTANDKSEVTERRITQALADYPRLKNVELVNADITDGIAQALLKLPEMNSLSLSTGFFSHNRLSFDSLAFLREAKQLTSLRIYGTAAPAGIGELRQLKSITADDNTLYDLSLLEPLQNLEQLYLKEFTYNGGDFPHTASSNIKDVEPLKHLPKLHSLELRFNGDKNSFSGFAELKQLKRLWVELDWIGSDLDGSDWIESDWDESNEEYDITPLGELKQLEELWLSSNKYAGRTPVCPIPSIEALAGLVNLTVLSVCGVKLQSLEPVRNMKNLRELYCYNNHIRTLKPLEGLIELRKLYCQNNHIRTLKPLEGLIELRKLRIKGNPVKDYTPIRGLPHYSKRWEGVERTAAYFDLDVPPETSGLLFYIAQGKSLSTRRQVSVNPGETVELKEGEQIYLGDVTGSIHWHMQKAAFKDFDAHIDLIMKGGPAFFLSDYLSGERYMIYEDEGQRMVMPFDTGVSIPYDGFKPSFEIGIIGSLKMNDKMESQASDAVRQCVAKLEEKRFWKQADIVIAQIRDIAVRFMESADMIEHLRKEKLPVKSYVDIIMASRAPLSEKVAVLRVIYDVLLEVNTAFHYRCKEHWNCIGELDVSVKAAEFALTEREDNTPAGSVFMLAGYNLGTVCIPSTPFGAFDAARKWLLKESAEYDEAERYCLHYVIEKWIPAGDGTMIKTIAWYLSHEGVIWFAVTNKEADENLLKSVGHSVPYDYKRILEYKRNHDLAWMTVPFKPGDIVTVDCRPTRNIVHAVITYTPSSSAKYRDTKCMYVAESGKCKEASLNRDLPSYDGSAPLFTGMLNLTKFTGQLPIREMPLQEISEDIKPRPH